MACEGRYLREVPYGHGDKQNGLDAISPLPEKFKDRTTGVVTIEKKKYRIVTCVEPLWWFTSKPYRYSLARIIQRKFRRFFKYLVIDEAHEQQSDEAAQSMAAGKLIGAIDHVLCPDRNDHRRVRQEPVRLAASGLPGDASCRGLRVGQGSWNSRRCTAGSTGS